MGNTQLSLKPVNLATAQYLQIDRGPGRSRSPYRTEKDFFALAFGIGSGGPYSNEESLGAIHNQDDDDCVNRVPVFGVWVCNVINERKTEESQQIRYGYRLVGSPGLEQAG